MRQPYAYARSDSDAYPTNPDGDLHTRAAYCNTDSDTTDCNADSDAYRDTDSDSAYCDTDSDAAHRHTYSGSAHCHSYSARHSRYVADGYRHRQAYE